MEELIDKLNALETIDAASLQEAIESCGFTLVDDDLGENVFQTEDQIEDE